jgi:Cohesin domain
MIKQLNTFFTFCLMILMTVCFSHTAFADKTLTLSTDVSVNNAGDDADRTALLDVTLAECNDVNGLAFTLTYNQAVFTFEGLEEGDMGIDDGSTYDPSSPPSPETIENTLYYQVNNKPAEGIVMISAATANFFTENLLVFKVKFKVQSGLGNGEYAIGIQKTIIGPDTAASAGYTEEISLDVAAGLNPASDPTTAQTYEVVLEPGLITVYEDSDNDGLPDDLEATMCTDANDADSDDDGIIDGSEDANQNGIVDAGETDPCNIDTDGDGIQDGTELGLTLADIDTDTDTNIFQPDLDPGTTTNPLLLDSDGDGYSDGEEDKNHNGRFDEGESNPNDVSSKPSEAMPWIPLLLME